MTARLNHTIVAARDRDRSAVLLAEMLIASKISVAHEARDNGRPVSAGGTASQDGAALASAERPS